MQDFARQGAVVLRGVLTPDEVATLAHGMQYNLAHLSPLAMVASQADDPGKFVEDFCTWQHNADYAAVMLRSALPRVAAALMQSDAHPEQFEQLAWALQPGDAAAFHMLTLHASSGVGPASRRRVFSARYMGRCVVPVDCYQIGSFMCLFHGGYRRIWHIAIPPTRYPA